MRYPMSQMSHEPSVTNIVAVWRRASWHDKRQGMCWYETAADIAHDVGHGETLRGAGILAALSPQKSWPTNVSLAQRCSRSRRFSAGHFRVALDKARAIHRGADVFETLNGPKTRAFACNIAYGSRCPHGVPCVTIDRHAVAVAYGRVLNDTERAYALERAGAYDRIADLYRQAARRLHVEPHRLQAVTWVTWRRELGITEE